MHERSVPILSTIRHTEVLQQKKCHTPSPHVFSDDHFIFVKTVLELREFFLYPKSCEENFSGRLFRLASTFCGPKKW